MPKPPKDYSQNVSVKVENSLSIEWLTDIHAQFELSGDMLAFAHEVKASHMLFIAAKEAAVTAKAHHLHFDRLARDPKTYLRNLSHQHRHWLKQAGWSGDGGDISNYINQAREFIPTEQTAYGWKNLGSRLWEIWLTFGGKPMPFEGLDGTLGEEVFSGFPSFYKAVLESVGHNKFQTKDSLRSSILRIKPSYRQS